MSIQELLKTNANVSITINAFEMKEAFLAWHRELKEEASPAEEILLTAQEAADRIPCDPSTLWRWNKSGYLKSIKVGSKVRYRMSDIQKLMEG
ncbi:MULTISPECIES: helix-turn-helix domain-containing protein [unclassified Parabacteroides]|uniref:helix-turn-helix domain-containing protein n=1 Tax=unclassified Parabacteroides TaxID=2649774 RepID=UPI002474400F|nr:MULTISPECIES: helix-turn-helix domain-containing protein [unclassified Parabacteroides]